MSCGTAGEELPSSHDDIDVMGTELDAEAHPAGHLGGDHARPRAEKRVIDRLAWSAVVGDRTAHALYGFLCPVPPALLVLRVAKRVVVGDFPHRRLLAIALPVAGLALTHRVPADFVLPMVIAAAQGEVLLGPDDLSARLQPAAGQIGGDDVAVQGAVPDISDIPGEQRISLSPVGAIVVEHLSLRELASAKRAARPPTRFIADPVWRIGDRHWHRLGYLNFSRNRDRPLAARADGTNNGNT